MSFLLPLARRGLLGLVAGSLLFLTGCATSSLSRSSAVPAPVAFNDGAGRGDLLYFPVQVQGQECMFLVDTGSPVTVLDVSLEPLLGERLGKVVANYAWYGHAQMTLFRAPNISVSGTRLITGDTVQTDNLRRRFPQVGSSRVDLQACKLEYSIVSPK